MGRPLDNRGLPIIFFKNFLDNFLQFYGNNFHKNMEGMEKNFLKKGFMRMNQQQMPYGYYPSYQRPPMP
jgi:hypothetical protein